ncbi:uncharacterized protein LOC129718411 [Wyeomyia smithii]|uniref:uncharacterized protein LOC129718411 n=1 Tax=Wyeomyia smithii TaxID=174621 RepID=UPI002467E0E4|nr:uncharacterized protein LOC129718411 [Wyeomyia smithii]
MSSTLVTSVQLGSVLIALVFFVVIIQPEADGFKYIRAWSDEKPICSNSNQKLLSLFNLLCNQTQTTSITARDACYGCFSRAGILPSGQSQLLAVSQCATLYLTNTSYATCSSGLAAIATGLRPTTAPLAGTNCYTGYCEFVRCIRRINANALVNQCILQTLNNRNLNLESDRVGFYSNATACILARARCAAYNPITGELQTPSIPINPLLGLPNTGMLTNSLQVSPLGDIRIISFPSQIMVADLFCSIPTGLDQASYGDSVC